MMEFKSHGHLTLGIEIEFQLLDPDTLDLKPAAEDLLEITAGNEKIKPEIFQSMVEINSGICRTVSDAEKDLSQTMDILQRAAEESGTLLSSTGTHPFARYSERKVFPAERYLSLIDRNQWIARRLMICGLHVHLGMRDGDTCIRFNNFFLHMIPHLLALTASSPFWQGDETGLASCRSTIFESSPTAGHPCRMENWQDFSDLCGRLIKSRAITNLKDIWWDIRPSPEYGTLEIRACDGAATLTETLAVTSFIHALAHWYDEHASYDPRLQAPYMWMMRENKWRATRHGLDADIIVDGEGMLLPMRTDIETWIGQIAPQIEHLGYEKYMTALRSILKNGASHARQSSVFAATGSLEEVARYNVREFEARAPLYA